MTTPKLPLPSWLHSAMMSDTAYDRFVDALATANDVYFSIETGPEIKTVTLDGAVVYFTNRGAFRGLVVNRQNP